MKDASWTHKVQMTGGTIIQSGNGQMDMCEGICSHIHQMSQTSFCAHKDIDQITKDCVSGNFMLQEYLRLVTWKAHDICTQISETT